MNKTNDSSNPVDMFRCSEFKVLNVEVAIEQYQNTFVSHLPEPIYRDQVMKEHLYDVDIDSWSENGELPDQIGSIVTYANENGYAYIRFVCQ